MRLICTILLLCYPLGGCYASDAAVICHNCHSHPFKDNCIRRISMTILMLNSVSLTKYGVKWNFTRSKVRLYSEESPGLLGGKSEPSKCLIIKKLQTRQEKANIVYKSDV